MPGAASSATKSQARRRRRVALAERTRRCRGCRQSITGHQVLYRCVHCEHSICRACFTQRSIQHRRHDPSTSPGQHVHAYVLRNSSPGAEVAVSWAVPTLASASSPSSLWQQMQSRELTAADYDVLLQLDEQQRRQPVYAYLAASLPPLPPSSPSMPSTASSPPSPSTPSSESLACAFCATTLAPSVRAVWRVLPCGHTAHHDCVSSSAMYETDLLCALCQRPAFPGLHSFLTRTRRTAPPAVPPAAEDSVVRPSPSPLPATSLGVHGHQLFAHLSLTPAHDIVRKDMSVEGDRRSQHQPEASIALKAQRSRRMHRHESRRERGAQSPTLLPSLPPIHLTSLSGLLKSGPPTDDASTAAPCKPVHRWRGRTQSTLLVRAAAACTRLPALHSQALLIAPHPHTAPLPPADADRVRSRVHRGLPALKGRGAGGGAAPGAALTVRNAFGGASIS